ncbi:MAG: Mrp/NBP35 family ATP-binding protein [Erysipelotrichia bacterium]|nr:Mrp/NBP35 family ATP-binding protein [Erysipelotrichia bacterium]
METCPGNCATCAEKDNCSNVIEKAKANELSHIKKIIGVLSGKGGVGKSFVTASLATYLNRMGHKVGILDADITGPSIPKAFGIKEKAVGEEQYIFPRETIGGIKVISSNMLLQNESDPIIWRGSLVSNLVTQFFENVAWGELDVLLIDMPPGTGDVALTIFQSLPIDQVVVVTSPQDLVSLIVSKALKMAEMMTIPIIGVIENMSYLICPKCEERIPIFGASHLGAFAKERKFNILGKLPLNSENTQLMDKGAIEKINLPEMGVIAKTISGELKNA